jgi:hypothetical protein
MAHCTSITFLCFQGSRGDPSPWVIDGLVKAGSQGSIFSFLSLPVFLGTYACQDIGKIPGVYGMKGNGHLGRSNAWLPGIVSSSGLLRSSVCLFCLSAFSWAIVFNFSAGRVYACILSVTTSH